MGLPPNFDLATFLRMQGQSSVVSEQCYTDEMS